MCRQKSLEDALLVSGQFKDALHLLLDWLYKIEPKLNEDQPVCGDVDTVTSLIEEHRVINR
jgi:dystonin